MSLESRESRSDCPGFHMECIPIPSMGLVYLPTFGCFLMVRYGKCRYIYHTWMLWDRNFEDFLIKSLWCFTMVSTIFVSMFHHIKYCTVKYRVFTVFHPCFSIFHIFIMFCTMFFFTTWTDRGYDLWCGTGFEFLTPGSSGERSIQAMLEESQRRKEEEAKGLYLGPKDTHDGSRKRTVYLPIAFNNLIDFLW